MDVDDIRSGAVVKVTVAIGQNQWFGELCTVDSMHQVHGTLFARCRSWWFPHLELLVPVNEKSVELVAPAVPETAGGAQ